jgi:hypothetical protein
MTSRSQKVEEFIAAIYPDNPNDIILVPELADTFIGIASLPQDSSITVATYDRDKCIDIQKKLHAEKDAKSYFEYNVEGKFVGKYGPIFITVLK